MRHFYIKKASSHLNGKVERLHLTGQRGFYQFLRYTNDIDIEKMDNGEYFTTFNPLDGVLRGKIPYKVLRERFLRRSFGKMIHQNHRNGKRELRFSRALTGLMVNHSSLLSDGKELLERDIWRLDGHTFGNCCIQF